MRLIGMLDSPYVRRVAVSLEFMRIPFTHEAVSVFRHYDAFAAINPVVKAPSLVLDDGAVLMDSTLMLEYLEPLAPPRRRLMPQAPADRARALRVTGLALAACEKSVQIVYENLRPTDRRDQSWLDRVHRQLLAAYRLLESECALGRDWFNGAPVQQSHITSAVTWGFTQLALPGTIGAAEHPALNALAARAEALPQFRAAPVD